MKKRVKRDSMKMFLAVALVLGLSPALFPATDGVPKTLTGKVLESPAGGTDQAGDKDVPDEKIIGIPVYPGSKVYTSNGASKMNANGQDYETLPIIILATGDEKADVAAFYKEKLPTWKHKEAFGMFDVFWQEGEEFEFMDITVAATTPNVIVQDALQPVKDEFPGTKVQIQIVYKPNK